MQNNMINENAIREKIKYFFENKTIVHIKYKDSYFHNGNFKEEVRKDLWVFTDRKDGEVFIHLSEIKDVSKFMEDDKDGGS